MTSNKFLLRLFAVTALFFVLGSMTCYSGASVLFGHYAKSHSALWMSWIKAVVAGSAFLISVLVFHWLGWSKPQVWTDPSSFYFFISGAMGLGLSDVLVIWSFAHLGPARTLVIFSFQPLILGLQAALFLDQTMSLTQLFAILLLIICIWLMALERLRLEGRWSWAPIGIAFLGVLLDNTGVILTRKGFDATGADVMSANLIRCLGALVFLFLWGSWKKLRPTHIWNQLSSNDKKWVFVSSFAGTYLSLLFWLSAVRVGHLSTIAAVGGLSPIAASLWEWALFGRRPSKTLLWVFLLMIPGLVLLALESRL